MIETILSKISEKHPIEVKKDVLMSEYTTFRIGGSADYVLLPESADALVCLCREFHTNRIKYIVIGNGSNLLFPDEGFRGAVIVTEKICSISVNGNEVAAGCGASLIKLSRAAVDASLTGLEFAYGIPGTVGGAVYMNAGAYNGEISMVLVRLRCFDTVSSEIIELDNAGCDFSYRNSIFEKNGKRYVILDAVFRLEKGNKEEIYAQMCDFLTRRRDKQPLEYPSAGSAFKRAPGYFTAKLIDDAGLKGYRIGGAVVSEKHAGFIINAGGASAADVKALIEHIQKVILEKFGVEIESEIRIISNK